MLMALKNWKQKASQIQLVNLSIKTCLYRPDNLDSGYQFREFGEKMYEKKPDTAVQVAGRSECFVCNQLFIL